MPRAIRMWQRQVYPNRELIIVDSGEESVEALVPKAPGIRYFRVNPAAYRASGAALTVGAMRNAACEQAEGLLIAHWDDDDFSHPDRLIKQYELWRRHAQPECVGFCSMMFVREETAEAWVYQNDRTYCIGTSMMYPRSVWAAHHFDAELEAAEDGAFLMRLKRTVAEHANHLQLATIHASNTSPRTDARGQVRANYVPADWSLANQWREQCLV